MKTNHQRGFKQTPGPWAGPGADGHDFDRERLGLPSLYDMSHNEYRAIVATRSKTGKAYGDSTCGKHGLPQSNRGLKKFYNSRTRFQSNALEHEMLKANSVGRDYSMNTAIVKAFSQMFTISVKAS